MGMLIRKFIPHDPKADNIMMVDLAYNPNKYIGPPWRFRVIGSGTLVMELFTYNQWMLYGELTASYPEIDTLTPSCMLLLILTACSLTDNISMCFLGHIVGGCMGSIMVD